MTSLAIGSRLRQMVAFLRFHLRLLGEIVLIVAIALLIALNSCSRGPQRFECEGFEDYRVRLEPSPLMRDIGRDVPGAGARTQATGNQALSPPATDALASAAGSAADTSDLGATLGVVPAADQVQNTDLGVAVDAAIERSGNAGPQVLLLSGGGQWGAFGAGLFDQLERRGRLPDFDLITGVSTGALQALHLGAGDRGSLDALALEYLPATEGEIVDRGGILNALFRGSMAGIGPLRERIETGLCPGTEPFECEVIEKLAAGRRVLIGFVGANSGEFYFADVTKIAGDAVRRQAEARAAGASREEIERPMRNAQQCITGIALASSAIPVFFQPVQINRTTYFDGGVRRSVFEETLVNQITASTEGAPASPQLRRNAPAAAIYVVRNGPTVVPDDPKSDAKFGAMRMAQRGYQLMVNSSEVGSIASLRLTNPTAPIYLATADGFGARFEDPRDGTVYPHGCRRDEERMFDPPFMACLQALGRSKATRSTPWNPLRAISAASR